MFGCELANNRLKNAVGNKAIDGHSNMSNVRAAIVRSTYTGGQFPLPLNKVRTEKVRR